MTNIKKILLLLFTFFFILSCENTGDKQTLKQIAITLIANYADGKGQVPTIRNYEDAGIIGVNERNIDELNAFIETLVAEDIDTEAELNAVIDALGISLASDIFGPVITIHGPNPLTLNKGDTYKKVCATAIDGRDGEVQVYVRGDVDTSKVGTYIVTYSAVDEAGNLTSVDRIVNVITPPPVTPAVTTTSGYKINFTLPENDQFLTGGTITITLTNAINNDTVSKTWTYPTISTTVTYLQFSLPTTLQPGDNYNISLTYSPLTGIYSSTFGNVPFSCFIPASTVSSGTMGNADITLVLDCSNGL